MNSYGPQGKYEGWEVKFWPLHVASQGFPATRQPGARREQGTQCSLLSRRAERVLKSTADGNSWPLHLLT